MTAPAPPPVISFLSDFGRADEYVGVVHSVVLTICPAARIVDLSHEIPPHDVAAGAALLARAAPYLADGVALAVVDPGVGSNRRRLVLDCGRLRLVGPDNGLLLPAAGVLGGILRAFDADDPAFHLPPAHRPGAHHPRVHDREAQYPGAQYPGAQASRTFDARDVFGPVAAHLACGAEPARLGSEVDPADLEAAAVAEPWTVVHVDRFGNVALAAGPGDLAPGADRPGAELVVQLPGGRSEPAVRVATYSDLGPGRIGVLVDSSGRLAVVLDRAPAAGWLALTPGDRVEIRPT